MKQQLITVILTFTTAVVFATDGQHHSDDIQALRTRRENIPDDLGNLVANPSEQNQDSWNEEGQEAHKGNLRNTCTWPLTHQCANGKCLHQHQWCDGVAQCSDGTDETKCTNRTIAPNCSKVPGGRVVGNQCLVFSQTSLNWTEAKQACAAKGQVLANIEDMQGLNVFIKYNGGRSGSIGSWWFWTGGSDNHKEGTWQWTDGSLINDTIPWYSSPNGGSKENCLSAHVDGYYDFDCKKTLNYICAIDVEPVETSCSRVPGGIEVGNQCLVFNKGSKNFAAARRECKSRGQKLASINDLQGLLDFVNFNRHIVQDWCLIGASDSTIEGKWQWTDGSPVGTIPGLKASSCTRKCNCMDVSKSGYGTRSCEVSLHCYICSVDFPKENSASTLAPPTTVSIEALNCLKIPGGTMVGNQCLVFNKNKYLTWSAAKQACASKGQVLAYINNMKALMDYMNDIRGDFYRYFWTGGSDNVTEGTWLWTDGSPTDLIPWAIYQPDGNLAMGSTKFNCLAVRYDGYANHNCDDFLPSYICTVEIETTSPVSTLDPTTLAPTTLAPTTLSPTPTLASTTTTTHKGTCQCEAELQSINSKLDAIIQKLDIKE